ncbi:hypothetical protein I7I48_10269 [Histoplasma ohiense]|nr:hypothetical protein I7I48_10269 [Histoplasma ohiense (nom. inval.)]
MIILPAIPTSVATVFEASRGVSVPSLLLMPLCVHLSLLPSQILSSLVHSSPLSIPLLLFLQLLLDECPSLISVEIQMSVQLLCSLSSHSLFFWPVFLCIHMPIILLASLRISPLKILNQCARLCTR